MHPNTVNNQFGQSRLVLLCFTITLGCMSIIVYDKPWAFFGKLSPFQGETKKNMMLIINSSIKMMCYKHNTFRKKKQRIKRRGLPEAVFPGHMWHCQKRPFRFGWLFFQKGGVLKWGYLNSWMVCKFTWLVVGPALWKIWVRQLGLWHKIMFQTTHQL